MLLQNRACIDKQMLKIGVKIGAYFYVIFYYENYKGGGRPIWLRQNDPKETDMSETRSVLNLAQISLRCLKNFFSLFDSTHLKLRHA